MAAEAKLDEDGAQAAEAVRRRVRADEHCSRMKGSMAFVSKKSLGVATCDSREAMRCEISSQHLPIVISKLLTNERDSEPNVPCIHDDCSSSMRAAAAQALIAEIGFEIESIAASDPSLP